MPDVTDGVRISIKDFLSLSSVIHDAERDKRRRGPVHPLQARVYSSSSYFFFFFLLKWCTFGVESEYLYFDLERGHPFGLFFFISFSTLHYLTLPPWNKTIRVENLALGWDVRRYTYKFTLLAGCLYFDIHTDLKRNI